MRLKNSQTESELSCKEETSSKRKMPNEEFGKSDLQPPAKERKKNSLNILVSVIAIGLAATVYGTYRLFFYESKPNHIFLSGRIEGYEADISSKVGGKILQVNVREGDIVKSNQMLVKIDDADLRAQLLAAQSRVLSAQQRLKFTSKQIPILQAELEQANLTTKQAAQRSEGRVVEARTLLASAQAKLTEAKANLKLALAEQRRSRELFEQGVISEQQRDKDNAAVEVADATVEAARQQFKSAQGVLTQEQAELINTPIFDAAALQIKERIAKTKTDITISQEAIKEAKAQQAEVEANLGYLTVKSPNKGIVITRFAEPGEVVASGAPLLTLVDHNNLYLRGFIPTAQIGEVKVGQNALVHLDSSPNRPLEATVTRIDPKASFTPKNVYFKKDRVTQVFGVQLTLKNHQGLAKPGVPADGEILLPNIP